VRAPGPRDRARPPRHGRRAALRRPVRAPGGHAQAGLAGPAPLGGRLVQLVQYIGDARARERGFDRLYPLADLVTDLDPDHGYAYQTAGIVLSGEGLVDESDRILEKGIRRGPNWWSYPLYMAFNHYFYRGDYAEGARWAEIAARTPGASTNLSQLALALKVKSGSPEAAVSFLEEMLQVARDDTTRAALQEQYKLARLQWDFARLERAVEEFRARHGHPPARLDELVSDGVLDAVPPGDPFGGVYELRDGRVHATGKDFRFHPAQRGRLQPPVRPPLALPHP
jgi:tetratricopeptide (TPR) repeat protein